jgi:N-acetylglucosamine-6-sulfatase
MQFGAQCGRALVAAFLFFLATAAPAAAQVPNLVFILTDDQRLETVEVMPRTLEAFGVEFTEFVVTTPTCCPSRSSFLTGKWAHSTGVWTTSRRGYERFTQLEPHSLGPWLQAAGYYTGFVGKYFNGFARTDPVPPGWNEFYGRLYGADRGNGQTEFTLREWRAGVQNEVVSYPNPGYPEPFSTRVFGEHAAGLLERASASGQPFAVFLWTTGVNSQIVEPIYEAAPLPPWDRPPSFMESDVSDKPVRIRRNANATAAEATATRATQLRQSFTIDDVVGNVLDQLNALGERANTVGIFASDNGRFWGEHRLRGKWLPYEESVRVPFRMMLPSGQRFTIGSPTANVDVAPTIMALAGDTANHGYQGRSLLPLLSDPAAQWRRNILLEQQTWCGYRSDRWKYAQYLDGAEELYDLNRDPFELENRATSPAFRKVVIDHRERVRRSGCRPPRFQPLPSCTLYGTHGSDSIRGTRWRDWICAGAGDDSIRVEGGRRDVVNCGPGRDKAYVNRGDVLRRCELVFRE